jgi:hypothetical protein
MLKCFSGFILLGTEGGRMDSNERFHTNSGIKL